ncbi:autotransporter domain-containing protein [Hoeflea sp.]|uniref:autotransporter family protein n=1 Tax=Hoeflea sp. TaxID=1940281 RepID=UPI003B025903
MADDIVIVGNNPATVVLDGDDTLVITPSGSVTPPPGNVGVQSTGGNNEITNSGSIRTKGIGANGIDNNVSSNSPVTNNGSIHTEGVSADGIWNNVSHNSPVTNKGSIQTENDFAEGIDNNVSHNSPVTNSGSIRTKGIGADGIENNASRNSPVINSGSIRTEGENAEGIWNNVSDNASVTNNGSIHTKGNIAAGIWNDQSDISPITNSGSIHTEGIDAHGILNRFSNRSPVTNSGSIHTKEADARGIWNNASDDSPVTNSGSIHTGGSRAYGIWNFNSFNSPVTNSGSIHTKGDFGYGIWSFGSTSSPVTNIGWVVSERSEAIRIDDTDGVLNLHAPAFLGGAITFVQGASANITTGPSHSVLWHLPANMIGGDPTISGPVPWFYDATTKQFATYDPSGLQGSFNQLGNMTNLLSQVGRANLETGGSEEGVAAYAGSRVTSAFGNGGTDADNGQFWITGFGGSIDHDGDASSLGQTIRQIGIAAGYTWQQALDLQLNVMGGYIHGSIEANSRFAQSQDIDSDGVFAGVFGDKQWGNVSIDFGLVGGWLSSDSARFVNDNLALTNGLTLGQSHAVASFDSWFVAPEIGIGMDISRSDIVYTPSAHLRYALQQIDGFTESGSAANAQVGSRSIGMIEANVEVAAAKPVKFGTVTGRIGYLARYSTGDEAVPVVLLNITNTVGFGDTESHSAYLGLAADIDITPTTSLVLDGTGFVGGDLLGFQGLAKLVASY